MKGLLFLSVLLWVRPAAAQDFRLLYHSGYGFAINEPLLQPFERAVSADPARLRIIGIENAKGYYSNGTFLFDLPRDLTSAELAAAVPLFTDQGEAETLETPADVLFLSTATEYPLLQTIFRFTQDPADEQTYAPGARLRAGRPAKARLADGSELSALRFSDQPPGASWRATAVLRYRLLIDGKPVSVTLIGRPLGGPDRLRALVAKRLAELKEPVLRFSVGEIAIPPQFGIGEGVLLKNLKDDGYLFLAAHPTDIEFAWPEMLASGLRLLCTNLRAPPPFERVHIEEVLGVKVGFLSFIPADTAAILAHKEPRVEVQDPVAAAKEAVKELRAVEKVDLVVVVPHLGNADAEKLLREVEGIDLFLDESNAGVASRRKTIIELSGWNRERHGQPALRASGPGFSYAEIGLSFRTAGSRPELVRVSEEPGPGDPDVTAPGPAGDIMENALSFLLNSRPNVLPDPRLLWPKANPPKLVYGPVEFWNLAAQLLRSRTGAEVAFLRIAPLGSNVTGGATESFLSEWLSGAGHAATARLPGRALKTMLKRFPFRAVPVPAEPRRLYEREPLLAGAGLDKKGRVNGVPISDDEVYSVATTEELLENIAELPELKDIKAPRPLGKTLSELVLGSLKGREDEDLRGLMEGKTPRKSVWRLNLRELSMQFANTQVQNGAAFPKVADARVQGVPQVVAQGSAKLFSEVYWDRNRWDTGVSAEYGRVTVKPKGQPSFANVTKDDLLFETEWRRRSFFVEKGPMHASLGPFANVAYDTQFTKPEGLPKREVLRYKTGAKFFDGSHVKELYAGPAVQTDYSFPTPRTQWGYAAGLRWDSPLPGTPVHLKAEASYLEFFLDRRDTPADLRRALDVSLKFRVPFYAGLFMSPFVNYYLFQGKTVAATGYNVTFGFALDYSRLWKPFF